MQTEFRQDGSAIVTLDDGQTPDEAVAQATDLPGSVILCDQSGAFYRLFSGTWQLMDPEELETIQSPLSLMRYSSNALQAVRNSRA